MCLCLVPLTKRAIRRKLEEDETDEFDQRSDEEAVEDGREAAILLQEEID